MSGEIQVKQAPIEKSIQELQNAIQELQNNIGETIDGNKQIRMVETYNEIKSEYEELLNQYNALFQDNLTTTEQAVKELIELDQRLGNYIRMD